MRKSSLMYTAQPNNDMRPNADTLFLIYFQSCGAARDARRHAADLRR